MSIASEIQGLNTNLTAAKNAVTTKGGTVGDTGLAGLASEIASIPTGGGPLASYGTVTYLDSNNTEKTVDLATEEDLFEISSSSIDIALVHIGEVSFAKNKITSVTIAEGVTFLPGNFLRNVNSKISLTLPNTIIFIGSYFCSGTGLANELNLTNVEYIGDYFFTSLIGTYTYPVKLPKIEYIGNQFCSGASGFNSDITINPDCRIIGSGFLYGIWSYNRPITIPSGLENLGNIANPGIQFMYNCRSFVGPLVCNGPVSTSSIPNTNDTLSTTSASATMYTTGVTLTGPYATQWKAALPDRTSSPYRKLIIGS